MKLLSFIISFLCIASLGYAQPVRLDSMIINEGFGTVTAYGEFGKDTGTFVCDGVPLPIISWKAGFVSVQLPDTGVGSAGKVIITSKQGQSDSSSITCLKGIWTVGSVNSFDYDTLFYTIRYDLSSLLRHHGGTRSIDLHPTSTLVIEHRSSSGSGNYIDSYFTVGNPLHLQYEKYVGGYSTSAEVSIPQKKIFVHINNIRGVTQIHIHQVGGQITQESLPFIYNDFSLEIPLDSDFSIKDTTGYTNISHQIIFHDKPLKYAFPPEEGFISIFSKPFLIAPTNGSIMLATKQVELRWDTLKGILQYEVQYAKDSLFNVIVSDSVVNGLSWKLTPLEVSTLYYWRARGMFSNEQSIWSSIWSFTTGDKADVITHFDTENGINVYPNPSRGIVRIRYPELFNARVFVYNLQGNIIFQTHLDQNGAAEWDASAMASGQYIIGLMSGSELRSAVVSIVK